MTEPAPSPLDRLTGPSADLAWRRFGVVLGAARIALGLGFWVAPVASVRVAGLDAPTAGRIDWLARMTAARDVALGTGAAVAAARAGSRPAERAAWYLAGAAADVGDAVSITRGAREGRLSRVPAAVSAAGGAGGAVVGLVAAARELLAASRSTSSVPPLRPAPGQAPKSS